jgi:hypothetical protein
MELFWFLFFLTAIIISVLVYRSVQLGGRRQHELRLKVEERMLLEAQNRRLELEYQQAQTELERFGQRTARDLGLTPRD